MPVSLSERQLKALSDIVGEEYLGTYCYARLSAAYGKPMYGILRINVVVSQMLRMLSVELCHIM